MAMLPQPLRGEPEEEHDGAWVADVIDRPGMLAFGANREEALAKADALALRVSADSIEHGERALALLESRELTEVQQLGGRSNKPNMIPNLLTAALSATPQKTADLGGQGVAPPS